MKSFSSVMIVTILLGKIDAVGAQDINMTNLIQEQRINVIVNDDNHLIDTLPEKISSSDINGNWLRDDLEIYLSYRFYEHPKERAAYIQMSNIFERIYTDNVQSSNSRQLTLWKEELAAQKCFKELGISKKEIIEFRGVVLSEPHKIEAYENVIHHREKLDKNLVDATMRMAGSCDDIIYENELFKQIN